ncbi:MAG TPA: hypothetical protein GX003_00490 [Acholeplasmataceae bacterium]|nr:hypothetical protein [Acholeplasmataceae bacterium]
MKRLFALVSLFLFIKRRNFSFQTELTIPFTFGLTGTLISSILYLSELRLKFKLDKIA